MIGAASRALVTISLASLLSLLGTPLAAQQPDSLAPLESRLAPLQIVDSAAQAVRNHADYTQVRADSLGRFDAAGLGVGSALQQVEGLYLRDYGGHGGLQTLSMRGYATNQTTVSINGVPYHNPQTGSVNFGNFYLRGFQSIDVAQANGSPAQNTLAGNVDLQTEPTATLGYMSGGAGSFGQWEEAAGVAKAGDTLSLRADLYAIGARENYPYQINEVSGRRRNANFQTEQLQLYTRYRPSDRTALTYQGIGFVRDQNVAGPVVKGNPAPPREHLLQRDAFQYLQYRHALPAGAAAPAGLAGFRATLKHHYDHIAYEFGGQSTDYYLHNALAQGQTQHELGAHWLTTNWQLSWTQLRGGNLAEDLRRVGQVRRRQLNLAVRDVWQVPLAGRGIFQQLRLQADGRANFTTNFAPLANGGLVVHSTWGRRERWQLFAHTSYSHRIPAFNELYYFGFGNSELGPEAAVNVDGGALWHGPALGGRLRAKLTAFYNRTRDKIVAVPLSPVRWSTFALGYTATPGLEGALTYQPWPWLALHGNATYMRPHDQSLTDGSRLPYSPRVLLKGSLTGHWGWLRAGTQLHYTGARYASLQNDRFHYMPPYALLDAFLQATLPLAPFRLSARLAVNNLTNRSYAVIQSYPMPGRRFSARLSLYVR
jgi:outer membrane cobalamin receptor